MMSKQNCHREALYSAPTLLRGRNQMDYTTLYNMAMALLADKG